MKTTQTTTFVKTKFNGMFSVPDESTEQCEFCYGHGKKLVDFTSFQVILCEKCINLVEFILHIVNDNRQYRR